VNFDDLVKREGIYYQKFSDVPFTGEVTGKKEGSLKDGKEEGAWVEYWNTGRLLGKGNYKNGSWDGYWVYYWDNGQLWQKGIFKDGLKEGAWVYYWDNGIVFKRWTGIYKNGYKISD